MSTLALNRPHRKNVIDDRAWDALHGALREVGQDRQTRAVVITSVGDDFCAGVDIGSDQEEFHPLPGMHRINDVAQTLHKVDKPTIAKVAGVAVGAAWIIALACGLVAASSDARFSQIFVRRALSGDFGGSWLLPRIVGLQQAKRLALLADFVGAELGGSGSMNEDTGIRCEVSVCKVATSGQRLISRWGCVCGCSDSSVATLKTHVTAFTPCSTGP